VDWNRVKDSISDKTRLIIINTPHNPTGSIFQQEDLDNLAALIRDRNIYVLSDEVYEHMVFGDNTHRSVLCHAELAKKSFAVFSFGKTYHATGWKLAYCVAPKELSVEFRKVHQFVTFTTSSFVQYAIADFLQECPEHALELPRFYETKRDHFCELLADTNFRFTPSNGTYFQLVDYGEISQLADVEFANYLTREKGVAAIPLAPFYETPPPTTIIRFCFCKDDSTLERAAEILRKL
jgi:methionine aminotransferase